MARLWGYLALAAAAHACASLGGGSGLAAGPFGPARSAFDEGIFSLHQGVAPVHRNIAIVLPVYNAADVLGETLARIARNTDLGWHIVIIDDASPDPAIAPLLSAWARDHAGRVTLISNPSNLGFVASANKGLECARARGPNDPVVLLNSDAWVPPGWSSRLIEPLADPNVASVTPLSNNAELLSVPGVCQPRELIAGAADQIDETARRLAPGRYGAIPTGAGFCMALSPRWLRRLGKFDPAFGRGYGEEVDWCQRAREWRAQCSPAPAFRRTCGSRQFWRRCPRRPRRGGRQDHCRALSKI